MNLSDIAVVATTATKTVSTTCPYCGVGCGVRATVRADGQVEVQGDADHASNFGRLCVKGSALGDTVDLNGRLLHPQLRDADGALRRVGWDEALDKVARGFADIITQHGPDAVALYVSGQILTEDYYIANKLMKGFIGSANIDTNSRLCMSSAVAGHKRAFGEDLVPCSYEDLEQADLVVLVGSNTAWCHPILFQRLTRAKEARPDMKIVAIDPRRTATCELADLHLPLRPGTDVRLFNGLLGYLARRGHTDTAFVDAHTAGLDDALAVANTDTDADADADADADGPDSADLTALARACKLDPQDLQAFFELFASTQKVVTAFSMGVNQSSAGTDKVNSIINCHLLTGRIGRPGMGPFSLTGQPNAMGGREVGGLANMLAAHMELANPVHRDIVQDFWQSPHMADKPGLKAVDLFNAIEAGQVKAVWVIATNPVVSLPDADQARRALARCELVVSSDIVTHTDTNDAAHVLLPALGWGEKDGTVTNSERRISRQRAFLQAPGEARADWDILCDVARRMGFAGFDYRSQHEIFDEHARLSAWRNGDASDREAPRMFDIGGLAGLSQDEYDELEPVQWPYRAATPGGTQRLFEDGRYAFADGRARFVPTAARAPAHAADDEFPLILNTGRVRDQWHTMTRTGKAARLSDHLPEPFVDMHPQDALLCGVGEGKLARVTSRWGAMVARVRFGGGIARGSVFVPIHWNDQFSSDARVGALVNPVVDPVSGEPEFKHTPVRVEEFRASWHGFVLSRNALPADSLTYWTRIQGKQFQRYEFAGRETIADRAAWARALLGVHDPDADWLEYEDRSAGVYHAGFVVNDQLEACVYVSTRADLPSRAWLSQLFGQDRLEDTDRIGLLLGQPMEKTADAGPTVCACFGVGRNTICDAVRKHDLKTPAEITACVKAGGNCGSCVPELRKLLGEIRVAEAG